MIVQYAFDLVSGLFGDSDGDGEDDIFGAESVRQAIQEFEQYQENVFGATLGEPFIVEESGRYTTDVKIVVPINGSPFGGRNRLVFDVPDDRNGKVYEFNQLLSQFGLDFETMEELEGTEVPIAFVGGEASIEWQEVDTGDESGNGGASSGSSDGSPATVREDLITPDGSGK